MDNITRKRLIEKNKRLINMVIERVKRDFLNDIVLIGLTGSFSHNDFHEKSDLDLCIVHDTVSFGKLWDTFIFDDVAYDFVYISWENLERKAALERVGVSGLTDLQIIYCTKPEYLERFNGLRKKAQRLIAEPINKASLERAKKHIDLAKQEYANAMLSDSLGIVRHASSRLIFNLVNALVSLNNTCIKQGIKRYLEEVSTYRYLPDNFYSKYMALIESKTVCEIKDNALSLLSSVTRLYDTLRDKYIPKPLPTSDNLTGTYESLWGGCLNKVVASIASNDKSYILHAARTAQVALNEMTENSGTNAYDIMQYFDADNPEILKDELIKIINEYAVEYEKVGCKIMRFETFEALYNYCMNQFCQQT